MYTLEVICAWAQANPVVFTAIVVYVIANLMPRPHPEQLTGWKRTFWAIIDGLCVLTAAKVPGKLKWLLANSPSLATKTHVVAEAGELVGGDGPKAGDRGNGEQPCYEQSETKDADGDAAGDESKVED